MSDAGPVAKLLLLWLIPSPFRRFTLSAILECGWHVIQSLALEACIS